MSPLSDLYKIVPARNMAKYIPAFLDIPDKRVVVRAEVRSLGTFIATSRDGHQEVRGSVEPETPSGTPAKPCQLSLGKRFSIMADEDDDDCDFNNDESNTDACDKDDGAGSAPGISRKRETAPTKAGISGCRGSLAGRNS